MPSKSQGRCTETIDIENAVFTKVKAALVKKFPNITVGSVTTYSPSKFPFVCIEEADNYAYTPTRDSKSNENHAVTVFELNVYSNKVNTKKSECKAILAEADGAMNDMGFTRNTKTPIQTDEATYRIFARYTAVVSQTGTIYRR